MMTVTESAVKESFFSIVLMRDYTWIHYVVFQAGYGPELC